MQSECRSLCQCKLFWLSCVVKMFYVFGEETDLFETLSLISFFFFSGMHPVRNHVCEREEGFAHGSEPLLRG